MAARSAPNLGAPAATTTAEYSAARSAVAAAAAAAAASCPDAGFDSADVVHVVNQAREVVVFAGAEDRGMTRSGGEAQGTMAAFGGAIRTRRTLLSSSSLSSSVVTASAAGTGVC
jgi:hypothetical protein